MDAKVRVVSWTEHWVLYGVTRRLSSQLDVGVYIFLNLF